MRKCTNFRWFNCRSDHTRGDGWEVTSTYGGEETPANYCYNGLWHGCHANNNTRQGWSIAPGPILTRPIAATGEQVPVIGMGSWITFNVGADEALREQRRQVLQTFFDRGGGVIDSSPMYGTSEAVIGYCLERIDNRQPLFAATKVWTPLQMLGPGQMAESRELWGVERFDLMQIHNMLNWEGHLETLLEDKAAGRIRYIGMTTSHGSRHDAFERTMAEQPLDVVQFTRHTEVLQLCPAEGLSTSGTSPKSDGIRSRGRDFTQVRVCFQVLGRHHGTPS